MVKKAYKVTGMDCDACAKMIELDLEDLGVAARCNYSDQLLEVEFDTDKISEEKISDTLDKSGYKLSPKT